MPIQDNSIVLLCVLLQTMVIPENRDGKYVDDAEMQRGVKSANQTVSSRRGGLQDQSTQPKRVYLTLKESLHLRF